MLGGAGFLLPLFRREQWERMPETGVGNKIKKSRISYLRLGILAGSGALGMNILFFLLRLTENSASYEQTAQIQYQVPFLFGIIFWENVYMLPTFLLRQQESCFLYPLI